MSTFNQLDFENTNISTDYAQNLPGHCNHAAQDVCINDRGEPAISYK